MQIEGMITTLCGVENMIVAAIERDLFVNPEDRDQSHV